METLDVIEKMEKYDEASINYDKRPREWTFYALNSDFDLEVEEWEDWIGHGDSIVEAYKDAME